MPGNTFAAAHHVITVLIHDPEVCNYRYGHSTAPERNDLASTAPEAHSPARRRCCQYGCDHLVVTGQIALQVDSVSSATAIRVCHSRDPEGSLAADRLL